MRARFAEFVLDTELRQVLRGREALPLTPKAFALLEHLVEQRPRALSKGQLLAHVWPATFVSEANLSSLIKEIRRALGDEAGSPRFIRTLRGFGYAFAADVEGESPGHGHVSEAAPSPEFRVSWDRREIALAPGTNLLGRTREAAVWVDHGSVSRRHATIHVADGQATIEDCGSKNGTSLNGRRLEGEAPLRDRDEILLGHARVVFRAYAAEPSTASITRES
ncbi:MAG: winged helix-turn-helix domain-containing protein [Vicinamibacteria bacterium]